MKFSFFSRRKQAEKKVSIEEIISNLFNRSNYFNLHSQHQPLFLPELEVSKEILEIITRREHSETNLKEIASVYNKIIETDHYNGAGWVDFKIILNSFFYHYGYAIEWDENTDEMTIKKMPDAL